MVNAQRVFLKGNCHFLQDRPHSPVFLFENPPIMHFQIRKRWDKKFSPGPGRKTWSGHLRPAWVPPAPAGCPPGYPPHKPGTHHTHSLTQSYIHTERHHKNPKDISFGKKIDHKKLRPCIPTFLFWKSAFSSTSPPCKIVRPLGRLAPCCQFDSTNSWKTCSTHSWICR